MSTVRKIINDPVYGFITINDPLILDIISHPYYQRLRNIHQMAFAYLVYPGAVHSRLHHSLGAYHLMCTAIAELRSKGVDITADEELGVKVAILLHDIGHGPFSHALESEVIAGVHHETLSLMFMQRLNQHFKGALDTAIAIFTNKHPKFFLHQLISGQLDMDRLDYLNRDSFFTGVAEGVVGYDRIIKMLAVKDNQLMVEEKGIYSIEKFLVSRRLMYGQVYLHKTVIGAEMMLIKVIRRAKELIANNVTVTAASPAFNFFLHEPVGSVFTANELDTFCLLDDHDIMTSVKNWMSHPDKILSLLCRYITARKLYKTTLQNEPFSAEIVAEKTKDLMGHLDIDEKEASYFVFTGETSITTYNVDDERINILFKNGEVKDISQVDNALISKNIESTIKKYYICLWRQ